MTNEEQEKHFIDVSDTNLNRHSNNMMGAFQSMNNIIFIVSTGAFALTISFVGYIKTYIYNPLILLISWIFLFLAITFNFIAHWITAQLSKRSMELTNEWRSSGFPDPKNHIKNMANDKKIIRYKKMANIDNILVLIFLPLGIISLISFAWINFSTQNNLNKNITPSIVK